MRVPVSWLREYVSFDMPVPELGELLSMTGTKLEALHGRGVPAGSELYRVGKVVSREQHPNADRLSLCFVDVGEGQPRQIVCGARNFEAGATVAVVLPGATLPGGVVLKKAKLRGLESDGMILSERELELSQEHEGIMLLPGDLAAGDAAGRRVPGDRAGAGAGDHLQPAGLPCRVRRRPRGLGSARHRSRATARHRAGAHGRGHRGRLREGAHRRPRPVPAMGGQGVHRRHGRPIASLAEGPDRGGRHAVDLQRRRHHQLRDADPRRAHPRLRPGQGGRTRDHCPAGGRRRARDHAGRPAAHAGHPDAGHRGCREAIGDRRADGRRVERGHRLDDHGADRVRELRRAGDPGVLHPAGAAHGGLVPLGEGPRPVPSRPGAGAGLRADGLAVRRPARSRHARPARRTARAAAGRPAPRASRAPDRHGVLRGDRRARADAARLCGRGPPLAGADLARRRYDPRGRPDRGGRPDRWRLEGSDRDAAACGRHRPRVARRAPASSRDRRPARLRVVGVGDAGVHRRGARGSPAAGRGRPPARSAARGQPDGCRPGAAPVAAVPGLLDSVRRNLDAARRGSRCSRPAASSCRAMGSCPISPCGWRGCLPARTRTSST